MKVAASCDGREEGLHHNLLVVVLRMIVSLHHRPQDARQELVAALGDDVDALPPASLWSEALGAIRLTALQGIDTRVWLTARILTASCSTRRSYCPSACGKRRERAPNPARAGRIADPQQAGLKTVEGKFLGVCDTGGFRSLARLDECSEESEFFLRPGGRGTELIIDNYRDDRYGFDEFLNAMTKGRNLALTVRE